MSKIVTQSLEGGILHAFGLTNEFLKVCPDAVWGQKFGGWPVWQQMFHAYTAIDFFLRPKDAAPEAPLFGDGVGDLKQAAKETPAKAAVQDYIEKAQAKVRDYIAGLDDAALGNSHAGLSARFGREVTHAATLALIGSHTMYHLGSCDAALRENGMPGVF